VTFDSERWDTANIHDTTTNTSRLTAPVAGKYFIFGHVRFATDPFGARNLLIVLNNTNAIASINVPAFSVPDNIHLSIATHHELQAGDYVELKVSQTSGGPSSVSVVGEQYMSAAEFGMVKLP
jgi:hypothetical protein